jgi:nucleotide-binding universal stress UspA family protein
MLRFNRILVPLDSSHASTRALDEALRLARRAAAEIDVLRVDVLHGELPPLGDSEAEAEKLRDRMASLMELDKETSDTLDPRSVRITHALERDVAAAPAILRYADDHDVDLIMMGTHGRRGVSRMLLGSVAEEVVRHADCPVITFHADKHEQYESAPLKSILVPIDFSSHSRFGLEHAQEWASLYGARLDLLHVVEDYLHPAFYMANAFSIYKAQPEIVDTARLYLKRFYSKTGHADTEVEYHVRSGRAHSEIVDFAEEAGSDLIIMPTHGLTGLDRFLLGSVAEKVVRHAACPVLTVRPFGKSLLEPSDISTTTQGH